LQLPQRFMTRLILTEPAIGDKEIVFLLRIVLAGRRFMSKLTLGVRSAEKEDEKNVSRASSISRAFRRQVLDRCRGLSLPDIRQR
jgi:hypothetical protein